MKTLTTRDRARILLLLGLAALGSASLTTSPRRSVAATPTRDDDAKEARFLVRKGDRVAWVGSSSTRIGIWPHTVEFLLRTRHPDLDLTFRRFTTGGGTFKTGLEHLDEWLGEFRPTLVIFNYGGNDAKRGPEGLAGFKEDMKECVARVRAPGRPRDLLHRPGGRRPQVGGRGAALRTLYAETMLDYGRRQGWPVIDVHHPLDVMQLANQEDDPSYTILKDKIHLTDPAYIAWGYLFFDRLDLPFVRSAASLDAAGKVLSAENCTVR